MTIKEQAITLKGLRFYAYHGADPQEAIVGAWYTIDLTMNVETTASLKSDDLNDTLNYAQATRIIKEQMMIRSNLIEHVAGRIAKALFEGIPALQKLTVTVSKLNPPVAVPCTSASFTLTAERK